MDGTSKACRYDEGKGWSDCDPFELIRYENNCPVKIKIVFFYILIYCNLFFLLKQLNIVLHGLVFISLDKKKNLTSVLIC